MMRITIFLVSCFSVVGCGADSMFGEKDGGDDGGATQSALHSMLVTDEASLPECSADAEGWIVYVSATKTLKACQAGAWSDIELKSNRVIASIDCNGLLEDTNAVSVSYSAVQMENGDVFVNAEVAGDGRVGISKSEYYSSQQNGAAVAGVVLMNDLGGDATSGFWTVSLDRSSLVTTVVYRDSELDPETQTWSMPANKCTLNKYP